MFRIGSFPKRNCTLLHTVTLLYRRKFCTIKPAIYVSPNEERIFNQIVEKAHGLDVTVRVAGGWVRNKLMGIDSGYDIDLVVDNLTGMQFYKELESDGKLKFNNCVLVKQNPEKSKHLETVVTKIEDFYFDFVHLRKEKYEGNSRIPTITLATPEEDAYRRDFTLNSLFYNLNEKKIEDFTKLGLFDLKNELLRTPLPAKDTFADDPLRGIRALRFRAQYKFAIHPDIYLENLIKKVTSPRIKEEFFKMFSAKYSHLALIDFFNANLFFPVFFKEIKNCEATHVEKSLQIFNYLSHNFPFPNASPFEKFAIQFSGLLSPISIINQVYLSDKIQLIYENLNLSKKEKNVINAYLTYSTELILFYSKNTLQDSPDHREFLTFWKRGIFDYDPLCDPVHIIYLSTAIARPIFNLDIHPFEELVTHMKHLDVDIQYPFDGLELAEHFGLDPKKPDKTLKYLKTAALRCLSRNPNFCKDEIIRTLKAENHSLVRHTK